MRVTRFFLFKSYVINNNLRCYKTELKEKLNIRCKISYFLEN